MSTPETAEKPDFSTRLHELRSSELRRLPAHATRILHGGAAQAWYFKWFEENYPGVVEQHLGIEAFVERPEDLPANVQWLKRTLGDMSPVPEQSVDMVFGGQVLEHLWAEDVAGFLLESHRVLRPGGVIALDSPNRRVTEAIAWHHPQHTVEFSVEEIRSLMELAGFEVEELRGVLLGYDRRRHAFLALEDESMPWRERAELAGARPEDSFVWWLVARRSERGHDVGGLREFAARKMDEFRARRLQRSLSPLPVQRARDRVSFVSAPAEYAGPLLQGPNFPLDRGPWRASVAMRLDGPGANAKLPMVAIEVTSEGRSVPLARRDVFTSELGRGGAWRTVALDFELSEMLMGLDVRVHTHGRVSLSAQTAIELRRPEDGAIPDAQTLARAGVPEPKTVEIAAMLARRAAAKTRAAVGR